MGRPLPLFMNKLGSMKKPYRVLWAILTVTFAGFLFLSVYSDVVERLDIRTGAFAQAFWGDPRRGDVQEAEPAEEMALKREERRLVTRVMDTTGKNILFIGDSMLEGLAPRLGAYCETNGHRLHTVIWYSSTTQVWGESKKLARYIRKFRPDYIFICLGSNELFVKNIKQLRRGFVEEIVSEVGDIPYVWIGPPNWKPDTGINSLLQAVVPKGNFYLSYTSTQHYDRSKDGAHPTRRSAAAWMDRVCHWIEHQGNYPIRLHSPKRLKGRYNAEVLQPVS